MPLFAHAGALALQVIDHGKPGEAQAGRAQAVEGLFCQLGQVADGARDDEARRELRRFPEHMRPRSCQQLARVRGTVADVELLARQVATLLGVELDTPSEVQKLRRRRLFALLMPQRREDERGHVAETLPNP